MNKLKVLLTNSNYRNTLAAVRGITDEEYELSVAGDKLQGQSAYSKYVSRAYQYTSPRCDEVAFVDDFIRIINEEKPDVILPIGTDTTMALAKHRARFPSAVHIPISNYESMLVAHDKYEAMKLAESLGVPIPPTSLADQMIEGNGNSLLRYPVVVKARKASGTFTYADNLEELKNKAEQMAAQKNVPGVYEFDNPVIQEKIEGEIHDCCAIFVQGEMRAALTQKRLKTFPGSGGPGILNETTYEPELIEFTKSLLGKLNWHGVGLTEFIIDKRDGTPRLLEINPKFWGTTALSVVAGMNFPLMACRLALEGDIPEKWDYKVGIRFRWLLPFVFKYYLEGGHKYRDLFQFLNVFPPWNYSDISLRDFRPTIFQLRKLWQQI